MLINSSKNLPLLVKDLLEHCEVEEKHASLHLEVVVAQCQHLEEYNYIETK
jgi:hypothetical protein